MINSLVKPLQKKKLQKNNKNQAIGCDLWLEIAKNYRGLISDGNVYKKFLTILFISAKV